MNFKVAFCKDHFLKQQKIANKCEIYRAPNLNLSNGTRADGSPDSKWLPLPIDMHVGGVSVPNPSLNLER